MLLTNLTGQTFIVQVHQDTNNPAQTLLPGNSKPGPVYRNKKRQKKKSSFFFVMGWIGLFAVLAGFAKTFIIPVSSGSFKAPVSIHVHGAFALSWIILFVVQTFLIRAKNYRRHIALGTFGLFLAIGTALTMLSAGVFVVERELKQGLGGTAYSGIVGVCTTAIIFLTLVSAGMIFRRKKEVHKRLMLLATIVVLWPAWFRFRHYFPSVPRPDIWFAVVLADSFIVVAWVRDLIVNRRIHPVLLWAGMFVILENTFEVMMFDHSAWQATGRAIYEAISFSMF